ncbi:hypothetical protein BC831DRAFT_467034 [Entophlyctis helioformis]|nr:hypothetical protein BC831DRAFT_467034 [Entophlyctis helioformis]
MTSKGGAWGEASNGNGYDNRNGYDDVDNYNEYDYSFQQARMQQPPADYSDPFAEPTALSQNQYGQQQQLKQVPPAAAYVPAPTMAEAVTLPRQPALKGMSALPMHMSSSNGPPRTPTSATPLAPNGSNAGFDRGGTVNPAADFYNNNGGAYGDANDGYYASSSPVLNQPEYSKPTNRAHDAFRAKQDFYNNDERLAVDTTPSQGGFVDSQGGGRQFSPAGNAGTYGYGYGNGSTTKVAPASAGKYDHDDTQPSKSFMDLDDAKDKSPRRYMCCFRTKRGFITFWSVMSVVLLAMAAIGFLFFPRIPVFKVLSIDVVRDSNQIAIGANGGISVTLNMTMNVSVVNSNRYYMKIESIDLVAELVPNVTQLRGVKLGPGGAPLAPVEGQGKPLGFGKRPTPITFPANQNTTFQMDFNLNYETDVNMANDIAFGELLQGCGFLRTPRRPMRVLYRANAVVDFFRRFGYTPHFDDELSVNCPGPIAQALLKFDLPSYGIDAVPPAPRSAAATSSNGQAAARPANVAPATSRLASAAAAPVSRVAVSKQSPLDDSDFWTIQWQ